ncbi:MAG: response regulator [Desulfobacteraceae bacterium]|nr:response regulator [Desulfobacteraceae bacterium]
MIPDYQHKVLVVISDTHVSEVILNILEMENLKYTHTDNCKSALENLKTATQPFSLIISGQQMPDMQGTQLLEHAKKLSPATIRFLLTEDSNIQTIINAVNKGSVQWYVSKPWDNDKMIKTIGSGIGQYEQFLKKENLITLAKKQNAKLYELNCELMETAKAHDKNLIAIDSEIESIKAQLKELTSYAPLSPTQVMEQLQAILAPQDEKSQEVLNALFSQTINTLFINFNTLASKNEFEMPVPSKRGVA